MPPLSQLPGDLSRKKFCKALERLGFIVDKSGGDGSHYKIICPNTEKTVTLPKDLRKDVLYYVLKEIETYCGVTWEQIQKEL